MMKSSRQMIGRVVLCILAAACLAECSFGSRSRRSTVAANLPQKRRGGKPSSRKNAVPRKRFDDFFDEHGDDDEFLDDDDEFDEFGGDGFDDEEEDDEFDDEEDDFVDDEDEEDDFMGDEEDEFMDDEEEEDDDDFMDDDEDAYEPPTPRRRSSAKAARYSSSSSSSKKKSRGRGGGGRGMKKRSSSSSRLGRGFSSGPRRMGKARRRPMSSRGSMVPYHHYRQGPTMTERMLQATKEMATVAAATSKAAAMVASKKSLETMKKAQRAAKEKTSSEFEKLLLRATSPEDMPVMIPDMNLLFKEVKVFQRRAKQPGVNPYEKTLHKLWNKIAEKDWRTTAKGVDILHRLGRDCRAKDCRTFADHIGRLKRARHVRAQSKKKKMLYRYFDPRGVVGSLDASGEPYGPFLKAYFNFVMLRLKGFTGRFSEAMVIAESKASAGPPQSDGANGAPPSSSSSSSSASFSSAADAKADACPKPEDIASMLADVRALVEVGLSVECILPSAEKQAASMNKRGAGGHAKSRSGQDQGKVRILEAITDTGASPIAEPNIVICDCQYLVADDLEQLWKAASLMLGKVLRPSSGLSLPSSDETVAACEWWLATLPRLAAWRKRYKRSMSVIKMRAPERDLEAWLQAKDVVAAMERLQNEEMDADGEAEDDDDDDEEEEEEEMVEDDEESRGKEEGDKGWESPAVAAGPSSPSPGSDGTQNSQNDKVEDEEDEDFEYDDEEEY